MRVYNFRHIIVFMLILMIGEYSYAQKKPKTKKQPNHIPTNLENFDNKILHFGFVIGINSTDFIIDNNLNDSLIILESQKQSGFDLGIISDLHLGPYFNIRFIPTLSFAQRNLEYTYKFHNKENAEKIIKPVESTFIEFPLALKYRAVRANNFAPYVIIGGKYCYDLASQSKTDNSGANINNIVIKLNRNSYLWEVGVGFDFFLQYFKFAPELKMSYGLNNVLINDHTILSDPIKMLKSKIFTLSFTFEG